MNNSFVFAVFIQQDAQFLTKPIYVNRSFIKEKVDSKYADIFLTFRAFSSVKFFSGCFVGKGSIYGEQRINNTMVLI